jgi:hypothetical protein
MTSEEVQTVISATRTECEAAFQGALLRMHEAVATAKRDGRVLAFAAASSNGEVIEVYADGEVKGFQASAVFNRIPHLTYGQLISNEVPASAGGSSASGE